MPAAIYDCVIIGGGIAGLTLSILLAREGKKVILFEKEVYPFHKVCGEYISNESVPFLDRLGLDLRSLNLPQIKRLHLSSPWGLSIRTNLDVGGTGLSRFILDNRLSELAVAAGAEVAAGKKVRQVQFKDGLFAIDVGGPEISARTVVGAYGKGSNIDVQLGRKYKAKKDRDLFIAVKHHIVADFDPTCVEMHNFSGGYCGMSAIEGGKVNMSYISRAANLKEHGSIAGMERAVLSRNPYLKKYFRQATFVFKKPLTISHLSFEIREPVAEHILMLGDSAGNIAPLSGNGMSIALQSAKLASEALLPYLNGAASLLESEESYASAYYGAFSKRIRVAGLINRLFGQPFLTDLHFLLLKISPGLVNVSGGLIHGEPF